MRSRTWWGDPLAAVVAAVSLAAVTACGGGETPGPAPVRIGALVPVSGFGLSYYGSAFQAAARSINARGGVEGRPVRIDLRDDHSDPNQAQACARKLVSDGVIATAADISEFSMVEGPILDWAPWRTGLPAMPRVTNVYGYLSSRRNGVEVLSDPTPFNPLQVLRLGA